MSSTHVKRLLTSVVAIPLLVLLIVKGGRSSFSVLVGAAGILGVLEYYALFFPRARWDVRVVGIVISVSAFWSLHWRDFEMMVMVWVIGFFLAAFLWFLDSRRGDLSKDFFSLQIAGLAYVPFLLGHLILIRHWHNGVGWVFFLFVVVFSGDTAAYYLGKQFGRHKLSPKVSPGKTWEGAVGGLLGSLFGGILFELFWSLQCTLVDVALLAIPVAVLGQFGDLFESMLKRSVGRKDSGRLLPGHGGVLDRIDGLLFAIPVLYYSKIFLLGR